MNITVYMLHPDNAEEMVFEAEDIIKHDGMFGITQPDWDAVKGHIPPRDVEQRFLNSPTDSMAIYQLRGMRRSSCVLPISAVWPRRLTLPTMKPSIPARCTRTMIPQNLENFYYIFNESAPAILWDTASPSATSLR